MKTSQVHSTFRTCSLILCLLLVAVPCLSQDKPSSKDSSQDKTAPDKTLSAKLSQLLDQSGYSYSKVTDEVWTIPFHGEAMPDFKVLVGTGEGMAVFFVIVAEKAQLKVTPELMKTLLGMNDDYDRVKIGIDKKGSLFVRTDATLRVLDVEELKANVEQVAHAADEVAKAAKPNIIESKPK